ncbi:hypothetical protein JCM24511_10168 [Saitozyma sp. JCM 24511]|nr:hypothetical protein JCM24511_10168 [Saitozyma sp. JCM 24511]
MVGLTKNAGFRLSCHNVEVFLDQFGGPLGGDCKDNVAIWEASSVWEAWDAMETMVTMSWLERPLGAQPMILMSFLG